MTTTLRIRSVQSVLFRARVATPVRTSFGVMPDRPALLARVEDTDGAVGWGEIWCNFPPLGAEHRAGLLRTVFAPLLEGAQFEAPDRVFDDLTQRTAVLALQSGEPGPFAQCIAGIDIALWDLSARRAGAPLWRHLGGTNPIVRVYASGINPDAPDRTCHEQREFGHRAFKLKVGFGRDRDLANLRGLRSVLGDETAIMIDANQGWTRVQALEMLPALERFSPYWLEEPIRADSPWQDWRAISRGTRVPIAAGENMASEAAFEGALDRGDLAVVQPDIAKWGGFSRCLPLARSIIAAGRTFCPHSLGGGIALLASGHLLAAVGGDGMLEVDCNPNPLRTEFCGALAQVRDGLCQLAEKPGLGVEPDLALFDSFRIRL